MFPYRSPKTLSYLSLAGLGVQGVCHLISLVIGVAVAFGANGKIQLETDQVSIWVVAAGLVGLVQFPAYIFTTVVFLMWLNRVYKNTDALGAGPLANTSGWAVGWWFIPFANLVKPFQVVRDAWVANDPTTPVDDRMFTQIGGAAPMYMAAWWGFWIAANILTNISSQIFDAETINGGGSVVGVLLVGEGVFWIAATLLAVKVVRDITERQEALSLAARHRFNSEPPPPPVFAGNYE